MLKDCTAYKYCIDLDIVGFYILNSKNIRIPILEFLFVSSKYIKQNISKQFLTHAILKCIGNSAAALKIFLDPNAKAFYLKYGFNLIAEIESNTLEGFYQNWN